jgi:hypothetical protein
MSASNNLIGAAGEHLVLSRLLSRGVLAAQAPQGTRKADIIVHPLEGGKPWLIQVKTRLKGSEGGGWKLDDKHLEETSSNLLYCFVDLQAKPEKVYVLPSKKVSEVLKEADKAQMKKPMRDGSKRTKHSWRMIKPKFIIKIKSAPNGWMDEYLENWDLLTFK